MNKPIVFVSGPFTGGAGPVANHAIALLYGQLVADAGGVPFIPHLYMAWDASYHAEYEVWMERCFAMIEKCDAYIRIPGVSPGADREVAKAKGLGLPAWTMQAVSNEECVTPSILDASMAVTLREKTKRPVGYMALAHKDLNEPGE